MAPDAKKIIRDFFAVIMLRTAAILYSISYEKIVEFFRTKVESFTFDRLLSTIHFQPSNIAEKLSPNCVHV